MKPRRWVLGGRPVVKYVRIPITDALAGAIEQLQKDKHGLPLKVPTTRFLEMATSEAVYALLDHMMEGKLITWSFRFKVDQSSPHRRGRPWEESYEAAERFEESFGGSTKGGQP